MYFVAGAWFFLFFGQIFHLLTITTTTTMPTTTTRLIDHFGREKLRQGSGVGDVAGGQSELAFQLVNLNAIPCTVIDPRPYSMEVSEWLGKEGRQRVIRRRMKEAIGEVVIFFNGFHLFIFRDSFGG